MQLTQPLIVLQLHVPNSIHFHHDLSSSSHHLCFFPRPKLLCLTWPCCFLLWFYSMMLHHQHPKWLEWKSTVPSRKYDDVCELAIITCPVKSCMPLRHQAFTISPRSKILKSLSWALFPPLLYLFLPSLNII